MSGTTAYAFHDAVKKHDMIKLEQLLKSDKTGDVTKIKDDNGITALDLAVQLWNLDAIELILDNASKPYREIELSEKCNEALYRDEENDETILFKAVKQEKISAIKALVHWGADIDHENCSGNSLLFYAINNPYLLSLLLSLGCTRDNRNYLFVSTMSRKTLTSLKLFLEHGFSWKNWGENAEMSECCTVLYALERGVDMEVVQLLCEYNHCGLSHNYLKPIIENYSEEDGLPMIKRFIKKKVVFDINYGDLKKDNTVLHITVWKTDRLKTMYLLLYYGADVNAINRRELTPLLMALYKNKLYMFKVLLFCKQDVLLTYLKDAICSVCNDNEWIDFKNSIGEDKIEIVKYLMDFTNDVTGGKTFLKPKQIMYYYVKRLIAGLSSDKDFKDNQWDETEYEKCKKTCQEELDELKKTIICEDVTYYKILRANRRQLVLYLKKPEVREALVRFETEQFPIYAGILDKNLVTGIIFESFYETTLDEDGPVFHVSGVPLPDIVVEQIRSYLSRRDLINWEKALNGEFSDPVVWHVPNDPSQATPVDVSDVSNEQNSSNSSDELKEPRLTFCGMWSRSSESDRSESPAAVESESCKIARIIGSLFCTTLKLMDINEDNSSLDSSDF